MSSIPTWDGAKGFLSMDELKECIQVLGAGGILAVPTETVYGLAVDAWNGDAVERLYALKQRPTNKGFAIQVSNLEQVRELVEGEVPEEGKRLLELFSPGPVTVIFDGSRSLPAAVKGDGGSIGVRIPDHPVMMAILAATGAPLAVTSANLSGRPPALTLEEVLEEVGHGLQGAVDGGRCRLGLASTVVDVRSRHVRILREGALPSSDIWRAMGV